MRVAHLADTHLGFRQYERLSATGANQREADVATAFARAIDGVIAAKPDLVLFAGDVFHQVRPPNSAILTAFRELARLRAALPGAPVILIAGDHDTPRSSETQAIMPLFAAPLGLDVVQRGIQVLERAGAIVTCVPQGSLAELAAVKPVAGRINILLAHGEARDLPHQARSIDAQVLDAGWDYVALGHYHVCHQVGPRAWYAGSLEYTSTDPWKDLREERAAGLPGKGWLLCELPGGAPAFQPIAAPRLVVDLERLSGENLSPDYLSASIAERLAGVPDGAVARLVVDDVARETGRHLDHAMIREHKSRLLQLHLDLRRPAVEAGVERRARLFRNLDEEVAAFLGERAKALPPDLPADEFQRLGMEYFRNAGASRPTATVPASTGEGAAA